MEYKVGDKVRVRGDLEVGKNYGSTTFVEGMKKYKRKITEIEKEFYFGYGLKDFMHVWTSEMFRPAEFKIWCETEEEKQAVLEELEKEGYVWCGNEEKPTNKKDDEFCFYSQMALYVTNSHIKWDDDRSYFESEYCIELTPSEFTGIDFSEKIIITKTPTGATATYGDKTVTTEGEFEDASRQALAEVLCPFKVGDIVCFKTNKTHKGEILDISITGKVHFKSELCNGYYVADEFEPCTEPSYNAKLFCIKGSDRFKEGHIYEIIDGKISGNGSTYSGIEDINRIYSAQFMEVKGGLDE